jgi:polyribonucleotide nucleotidyltransferase
MVEAGANQLPEEVVLECIWAGHREAQKIIDAQIEMFHALKLSKPSWTPPQLYPPELLDRVRSEVRPLLEAALFTKGKFERKEAVAKVQAQYLETLPQEDSLLRSQVLRIFEFLEEEILYDSILESGRRFDGRKLDELRPIEIEVGLLPRTHGSALFTRGETQALASVTLGTERDAQILEEYEGETRQKFMLHYNFPPFSVGEVKFLRSPGRREIGHGVLARRALTPLLPHEEDFPYTIRIVSDILESNGSSSMATVCGGSLALFDAGVPMLAPVAGVAMGLVKRGDRFAVLTDIAGQEDHFGDMDFKVAGTRKGITALQMDLKLTGVTREIMAVALEQARKGRLQILDLMEQAIPAPRRELSVYAPRLYTIQIPREKIRDVIGPAGKTIRSIIEETGCEIEVNNDGRVLIASPDRGAADRAIAIIERLTQVPEIGKVYRGIVRRIEPFGAFVEILPGQDGLVHISELAPYRVRETRDVVSEGDEIQVKVIDIDETGRIRLSRKAVILESPDYDPSQFEALQQSSVATERGGRGSRDPQAQRGGRGGRSDHPRPPRERR